MSRWNPMPPEQAAANRAETNRKWRERNRQHLRDQSRKWDLENPERARERELRRSTTTTGRAKKLFNAARSRAKMYNLPFDLTLEWVAARLERGTCEKTGLTFSLIQGRGQGSQDLYTASIDRITPALGYVQTNCRLIVWGYNCLKGNKADAEVDAFIRSVRA